MTFKLNLKIKEDSWNTYYQGTKDIVLGDILIFKDNPGKQYHVSRVHMQNTENEKFYITKLGDYHEIRESQTQRYISVGSKFKKLESYLPF